MGDLSADRDRIARLTAATIAARRIVEQANVVCPRPKANCQDDRHTEREPVSQTGNGSSTLTTYEEVVLRPSHRDRPGEGLVALARPPHGGGSHLPPGSDCN